MSAPARAETNIREVHQPPPYKWTKFVQVDGQPEPVPEEWVATPEGRFAHSIKIPNPVPKDSGYNRWMSAKDYFLHLCEKEAGEFIFKRAENVEGVLFMRPPQEPSDYDLMDRYKLEAPSFERLFQAYRADISRRGAMFVEPPTHKFVFYEEPAPGSSEFLRASDIDEKLARLNTVVRSPEPSSRYAITWRGVRRSHDREKGIAGTEIIVLDRQTNQVMGVLREFGITGQTRGTRDGIWWLNAGFCPRFAQRYKTLSSRQLYEFVSSVLTPRPRP